MIETLITITTLGFFCLIGIFMIVVPLIFIATLLSRVNEQARLQKLLGEQQFMQLYLHNQRMMNNWPSNWPSQVP